ncbi:hypothetical protein TRVA0_007S02124 [Trichomonascus vanleenenianus]|uniref:uncharacterized protein n=1 Tax=Trichomonascus vanleenenianus TaxID=2268995 RepID=UPI003EC9C531
MAGLLSLSSTPPLVRGEALQESARLPACRSSGSLCLHFDYRAAPWWSLLHLQLLPVLFDILYVQAMGKLFCLDMADWV